jgi:RNA polymerase sigma factor (sigma-70 family)
MGSDRRLEPSLKIIRASNVYKGMSAQPVVSLPATTAGPRAERLGALFDAHEDRLYRLARRLASTADEARDLVQETFLRAAQSLRTVPIGITKEEAWLVRVLLNIRCDQWRRTAVRKRSAATLRAAVTGSPSNPESDLIAKQAVWRALDVLKPRRRAIVIMHELEGMSFSAIASLLGLSEMTVRWHLSMGRGDLKRVLEPFVGDRT